MTSRVRGREIGTSYFFMAFLVHAHRMCALIPVFPSVLGGLAGFYRARVQRGESATARCASTGDFRVFHLSAALAERVLSFPGGVARVPLTARIERALFYRARSASKKGIWPLLPRSYYWIAESRHSPSWIRMKVQASPDSVGISSLPSTR